MFGELVDVIVFPADPLMSSASLLEVQYLEAVPKGYIQVVVPSQHGATACH
jgi:hypothetical protein